MIMDCDDDDELEGVMLDDQIDHEAGLSGQQDDDDDQD